MRAPTATAGYPERIGRDMRESVKQRMSHLSISIHALRTEYDRLSRVLEHLEIEGRAYREKETADDEPNT